MNRLTINASGRIFEIYEYKLDKWPLSLLGTNDSRKKYFDSLHNELYFNCNAESFEGIFNFYQSNGRFFMPGFVSIEIFYDEIKYFGLDKYITNRLVKCDECLLDYHKEIQKIEFKRQGNVEKSLYEPKGEVKKYVWRLLEYPHETPLGFTFGILCMICVVISVISLCIESIIEYRETPIYISYNDVFLNRTLNLSTKSICFNERLNEEFSLKSIKFNETCRKLITKREDFHQIELFSNCVFTVELILRLYSSKSFYMYLKQMTNFIDLVLILSFWIITMLSSSVSSNYLSFFRLLRLSRVLRVFKLTQYLETIRLMGSIMSDCIGDVYLLLLILTTNIVLFSSCMYYVELSATRIDQNPFISIPHTFWWAIVSFTSIGYGDLLPISYVGKFFGSLFICFGIMVALLPVPILSSKFEKIYVEIAKMRKQNKE
jgi:hypothetical protein